MSRPFKKRTPSQIVDIVTAIRRRNNICWMNLLRLALKAKPRKAKRIIREITTNDAQVTKWMTKF